MPGVCWRNVRVFGATRALPELHLSKHSGDEHCRRMGTFGRADTHAEKRPEPYLHGRFIAG